MCYLCQKYDPARDLLLKSKVLPAELFIAQDSLTRMFYVAKKRSTNKIGKQFIYNTVPVKLNQRTKQTTQSRFLKNKCGENSVGNNSCNKWNNLHVRLRTVKSK